MHPYFPTSLLRYYRSLLATFQNRFSLTLLYVRYRQPDTKLRTLTRYRFHFERTAVRLNEMVREAESQPHALLLLTVTVDLLKMFQRAFQLLRLHAGAAVRDIQPDGIARFPL